jgi:hypothetical protein
MATRIMIMVGCASVVLTAIAIAAGCGIQYASTPVAAECPHGITVSFRYVSDAETYTTVDGVSICTRQGIEPPQVGEHVIIDDVPFVVTKRFWWLSSDVEKQGSPYPYVECNLRRVIEETP